MATDDDDADGRRSGNYCGYERGRTLVTTICKQRGFTCTMDYTHRPSAGISWDEATGKGYRILAADGRALENRLPMLPYGKHLPFRYAPQKQWKFDRQAAKELLRHCSPEVVARALQELSPMGERLGGYGRRLVQETVKTAER